MADRQDYGDNRYNVNASAKLSYTTEGEGVGMNRDALETISLFTGVKVNDAHKFLDIGFGEGHSLVNAIRNKCRYVAGVDICQASYDNAQKLLQAEDVQKIIDENNAVVSIGLLDVSDEPLPYESDLFDVVICTECIEHLSNPHRMISEVKRVLKNDGLFVVAFPQPENNFGYGGGEHAHVYPGFLQRDSFEIFMRQMFFRAKLRAENGATAWYAYRNYKGDGVLDTFEIISGNYDEAELFKCVDK